MTNSKYKDDFCLNRGCYLLSHSVGRPLKGAERVLSHSFFSAWNKEDPWPEWLLSIEKFQHSLATFFNASYQEFCPQVNVSSAVTKIVSGLDRIKNSNAVILMCEIDFPSMGFVFQKSLPDHCELRFIPKDLDITDVNVWHDYLKPDVSLVFISHAYSNTGQLAPIDDIVSFAKDRDILTMIDVAQSAGIVPIDLSKLDPTFLVGSCVKWLCGGPGAGFLWVNSNYIDHCHPVDVGWFSHENPFEFDIHHFRYHKTSLKFWGGTPSIIPFYIAAHSLDYFLQIGLAQLREHNQKLIELIRQSFEKETVSPVTLENRSGTIILNFFNHQQKILSTLRQENIYVDCRAAGIRVSPHIYNDSREIERFIQIVNKRY